MLTFGPKLYGFRDMTNSAYSLIQALLGDFAFEDIQRAQFVFGPILWLSFVGIAVFVALVSDDRAHLRLCV